MIKRITYVSRYAKTMESQELEELGKAAAKKNNEQDITGILATSGGLFYQIIEGPDDAINELFNTIAADERHTDLVVIKTETEISQRLFAEWSMKTINLDAASHVRLLPLKALIKTVYENQRLMDNMTWAIERTMLYEMRDAGPTATTDHQSSFPEKTSADD